MSWRLLMSMQISSTRFTRVAARAEIGGSVRGINDERLLGTKGAEAS